ncbi:cyclase family protein [Bradyrhizobium sp. STM 3557]|uniref:cyclase family protein n=1 Tax=Bradyrhizobium sp. STM 3557 TaxID=578920 RepID=UPI00388DD7AA
MTQQSATRRWINRPQGSNWGDFGEDDQIGRLNLLTPEKVRQAVAEVQTGRVFCLSLPLDFPGGSALAPHRFPPQLRPTERHGQSFFNYPFSREGHDCRDAGCDDAVLLCTQYSTQWDSLAHIGQMFDADGDGVAELVYYNGYRAGIEVRAPSERTDGQPMAIGIENMAATGVQGRGVMVDLEHHFGRSRRHVGYDDLMRVMDTDGVVFEHGDILCLHTGFSAMLLEMQRQPDAEILHNACAALDGTDERLLQWITDSGVVAIAADNYAVEAIPSRKVTGARSFVPLHGHCLFKLGVHLGEMWHFAELNAWLKQHRRQRFLLTAPPLRLPGAVGSPVTPVATV